jgi:hypothetical protein
MKTFPHPASTARLLLASLLLLFPALTHAETAVQAWVQRYSNPVDSDDLAKAVVCDAVGNVIVEGYTDDGITGADMLIIKYSGVGVSLWTNRYNGPGNSQDHAQAVAVDGSNNVIVTGYSWDSGSDFDYATIKYSSAGVPLWINRYNGPGNSYDYANAVAVDGSNNVIVTGFSVGSGGYYNYLTIQYSSAGVPLWTNRYNRPGNEYDVAYAVAVDGSNNVIVTGRPATIKYSSAGVPLWTNYSSAYAVAVDGSNNVIVTGLSYGSGSSSDYATIKYSSAGVPLWTNR